MAPNLTNTQILDVYATAEKALRRTCAQTGWMLNDEDMADLQQQTLEKVIKSYDPARGTEPSALAWRVASNEARDFLRGRASAGAQKRDAREQSMSTEDEDGNVVSLDIADSAPNPLEMLEMRQLDAALTCAISELTPGQASGVAGFLASDDDAMTGAERIAKMRAVDALADHMKASHFVNVKREVKRGKQKKAKEIDQVEETPVPALATLRTLSMWHYICSTIKLTDLRLITE